MRRAWNVAGIWERRDTHSTVVGKHDGKKPLERPRRRWEN
jgi:hypothetical protein